MTTDNSSSGAEKAPGNDAPASPDPSGIVCPICGAVTVQEKCKVICRSDICRGRVIMNCAEF